MALDLILSFVRGSVAQPNDASYHSTNTTLYHLSILYQMPIPGRKITLERGKEGAGELQYIQHVRECGHRLRGPFST